MIRFVLTALALSLLGVEQALAFTASGVVSTTDEVITEAASGALSTGGTVIIALGVSVTVGLILSSMKKM